MTVFEKIYEVVKTIPKGRVATYGQVALLAGNPRWARVVGYALHNNPSPKTIPCHRVVNRAGRTAPHWYEQQKLLENEGVTFKKYGIVDMKKHQWKL